MEHKLIYYHSDVFRHEECLINVTGNLTTVSLRITLSLTKENLTLPDNAVFT